MRIVSLFIVSLFILFFSGCAIKDIIAKDNNSITIHYGGNDSKEAFLMASQHCKEFGKSSMLQVTTPEMANNFTSTWKCE